MAGSISSQMNSVMMYRLLIEFNNEHIIVVAFYSLTNFPLSFCNAVCMFITDSVGTSWYQYACLLLYMTCAYKNSLKGSASYTLFYLIVSPCLQLVTMCLAAWERLCQLRRFKKAKHSQRTVSLRHSQDEHTWYIHSTLSQQSLRMISVCKYNSK